MNLKYENFELSVYMTGGDIESVFSEPGRAERELAFLQKHLAVTKVYVEFFRGECTDRALLLTARDFFKARGLRVATGLMPVSARYSPTGRMICFTDPAVEALFDEMLGFAASEFDEIMVDDSFATDCTCPRCRAAKGDRTWQEFRTALMTDFSKNHLIAPARAANPNVKLTLKYPTWHESYQWLGYNTETQPPMFDEIYAGTETRHTTYSLFRNPRYTSYSLIRYLESLPPYNNRGGWFDPIQCAGSADIYMEQAELTLLAAPREITLFCWGLCAGENAPAAESVAALGARLQKFHAPAAKLDAPAGIPVYLPFHSRGEDHVFDFLGMCGIPADPVALFPERGLVLLTAASCCDKDLVEKIKAHLERGGDVCMTSGCLALLQDRGISDCTAMRVTARSQSGAEFGGFDDGWSADTAYYQAPHPISLPVIDWITNECVFLAMQLRDGSPNVLLAYSMYAEGRAYVLNIPDSYSDVYDIPAPVLNYLRKYLSSGLPAYVEGQAKIAFFPRRGCSAALRSYLPHGSVVSLHVRGGAEKLTDLRTGRVYLPVRRGEANLAEPHALPDIYTPVRGGGETVFELALEPASLTLVRWE